MKNNNNMKNKLFKIFMIIFLLFPCSLTACKKENTLIDLSPLSVYVLDGASVISSVNLQNKRVFDKSINVTVVKSEQSLQTALLNGSADMAIMPINLAGILNAKGEDVKLISVNTFGCLYIVGKNEISSLKELVNKKVAVAGIDGTPAVALRHLLELDKIPFSSNEEEGRITLNYLDSSQILNYLQEGKVDYALLDEPLIFKATKQDPNLKLSINLCDLWKQKEDSLYVQSGLCARGEFIKNHFELVEGVYQYLNFNESFVYQNKSKINSLIAGNSDLKTIEFTSSVLDRCNLGCKTVFEVKNDVEKYLSILKINYKDSLFYRLTER